VLRLADGQTSDCKSFFPRHYISLASTWIASSFSKDRDLGRSLDISSWYLGPTSLLVLSLYEFHPNQQSQI
jgi:hypothetical protein